MCCSQRRAAFGLGSKPALCFIAVLSVECVQLFGSRPKDTSSRPGTAECVWPLRRRHAFDWSGSVRPCATGFPECSRGGTSSCGRYRLSVCILVTVFRSLIVRGLLLFRQSARQGSSTVAKAGMLVQGKLLILSSSSKPAHGCS